MKKNQKYLLYFLLILAFAGTVSASENQNAAPNFDFPQAQNDTTPDNDTIEIQDVDLPYEFDGDSNNPNDNQDNSPLYGSDPSNIETKVVYDPKTGSYVFRRVLGDSTDIQTPYSMSMDDYINYDFEKGMQEYWRQRYKNSSFETQSSLIPKLEVGGEAFDRIFGSNTIDIKPQGSAELRFGINISTVKNPSLPVKMQRQTIFDFEEKIQMNVVGQIGDKMKLNIQYDTEAAFDFENSVKIEYTGHEDEIIQKIEAGNVSLPLTGSLIQGSQSLFGFKTELKFGRLTMTSIFSQQKGETSTITVEGGAQLQEFEIDADEYEASKHFFLAHYFKENYDRALANLPVINSGINITRIEVWVTNTTGNFENARNIIAFPDLGESNNNDIQSDYVNTGLTITRVPSDSANILLNIDQEPGIRDINQASSILMEFGMSGGVDFEKIESARMLNPNEYTFHPQLGYISLNSRLSSDQV